MRKYLLAGAATLSLAGVSQAAEMQPGQGAIFNTAQPGKAIVRLDTQITVGLGYGSNTLDKATVNTAAGAVQVKNNSYGMLMYARLYPAFDAQTPGGFRYGGFAEIRANNNTGGNGLGTAGTPSGVVGTAGQRGTNTLYWNRAFGYVGGDSWGTVRFGMTDGPANLMKVGTFENFADGGWNGTAPGMTVGLNPWQLPISGGYEYSSQKIVYLSPSFAGFDLGLSWAPSSATHQGSDGSLVQVGGSARQSSSLLASDWAPYTDLFEATARYRGTFGGVGLAISGSYMGSGSVSNANINAVQNRGISLFDGGATVSYAGFTFGGHYSNGVFNGNLNLSRQGEKNAQVWLLGASYENGPWTAGVHYLNSTRPGLQGIGGGAQQKEQGFSVGVTYSWAPGVRTFVELVNANRVEKGVNLNIGNGGFRDNINGTGVIVAQAFRW